MNYFIYPSAFLNNWSSQRASTVQKHWHDKRQLCYLAMLPLEWQKTCTSYSVNCLIMYLGTMCQGWGRNTYALWLLFQSLHVNMFDKGIFCLCFGSPKPIHLKMPALHCSEDGTIKLFENTDVWFLCAEAFQNMANALPFAGNSKRPTFCHLQLSYAFIYVILAQ